MANKITLGQRPKTFKPVEIAFTMPNGDEGLIEVTYKYRTRTEFGTFIDGIFKDAGEKKQDAEFSMKDLMEKTRDKNADYLIQCIDAWNLDVPLSVEALRQLSDEIPAAVSAIMEKYRIAAIEGRLGN